MMEAPLSVVVVLACVSLACLRVANAEAQYDTYDMESFSLCGAGKDSGSLFIRPWKAAILTFGNSPGSSRHQPSGRKIHECKVSIRTRENFGLGVVIQNMSIEATRNKQTHAWECDGDYLKISTIGKSTLSKIVNIFVDFFKSKTTEELCGVRKGKPRFTDVGSNADVFYTHVETIDVEFHQALSKTRPVDNFFTLVITTFKHIKEVAFSGACEGQYLCRDEGYCISPEYVCDGNYNCAFPRAKDDELKCNEVEFHHPIFSTTTTIITTLAAIVGCGFLVGCLIAMVKKLHSSRASQSRSVTPRPGLLSDASAPPAHRQNTLPNYEAVVMADADSGWKSTTPDLPPPGELPPKYESLFPDGPPPKNVPSPPSANPPSPSSPDSPISPSPDPSTNIQATAPTIHSEQRSGASAAPI